MRTATVSGAAGVYTLSGNGSSKRWKMPVILSLAASAVIGLLLFGMHQTTEAKLLQMQYMVQTVQEDAGGRVETAQRELTVMLRKFQEVESKMNQIQNELAKLQKLAMQKEKKPKRTDKSTAGQKKPHRPRNNGGIEDLGSLGSEVRLTAADDDPTAGFKRSDLL